MGRLSVEGVKEARALMGEFPLDLKVLQRVLDYLNDAVYITDRDRCIVLWNRRAEEITGHSREDVVGHRCRDNILSHVDKEGRPLCSTELCPLYRTMEKNSPTRMPAVIYARTKDRGRIPVSVSTAPLHDDAGKVIGGVEIFRDESEALADLELARRIQQHIQTPELPKLKTLEMQVQYDSLGLVGGDFYEVREVGAETAGVLVADVQGHGVSAALYTMVLRSVSDNLRASATRPGEFMGAANKALSAIALDEVFATAVYAVVEGKSGVVQYANAGHPRPLKIAPGKGAATLEGGGMPLGLTEGETYESLDASLGTSETMLLYTDGATDVRDKDGRMLGSEGLAEKAGAIDWGKGAGAMRSLHRGLRDFSGDVRFSDDVLLLSCRRRG